MNNTNYNMAVCGTSGAGKTGLIQPLIRSVLDSGGFAVVFDMGDGYKSLCENMGGVYLDGETLRFNPLRTSPILTSQRSVSVTSCQDGQPQR
ncbi:conjugal transfer ATP-binding protein TraC [Klebsiella pneumoniae]|nr:conjugal transfer ATP-binding protein TraC [Klebsiella pneumoniae]